MDSIKSFTADKSFIGKKITVKGWVRSRRDSKAGISFLIVNDGSNIGGIQCIISSDIKNYNEILTLTKDCSVEVYGELCTSHGKGQSVEIQAENVVIVGMVESPETYPVSPKRHTVEYLREVAHLRVRTNLIASVSRMRHTLSKGIHDFFDNQGFFWVNTPILTGSDCEGAGEMFRVSTLDNMNLPKTEKGKIDYSKDFFGKETFLTVSGQLNGETYCSALSKIYTFGPTFRAENSNTSRHLAEFWMMEPEVAFADLNDIATLAENMLKYLIKEVFEKRSEEIDFFDKFVSKGLKNKLSLVLEKGFVRLDYTDAIEILKNCNKKFEFNVNWGVDLQSEHERYLCEEHFNSPVILMNFPKDIKAFYMRMNDDGKTVAAMDVLVPGIGELIGGSQREERLNILDKRLSSMSINFDDVSWYRDLRKYGTVPHSGFGLGFERLLGYMTGVANIRDLIPFPRTPGSAKF